MQFSEILASMAQDGETWHAEVSDSWLQGRSIFGGLQAALLLRTMRSSLPAPAPLRVFQTTFVAPVPAGRVRARARVLRVGKSATQIEARLVDGGDTLALAVGIFGAARSSKVHVMPKRPHEPRGESFEIPFIEGLTPRFLQHFHMRWLEGSPLYTGDPTTTAVIAVGLKDSGTATEEHVLAIADAPPPLALSFLTAPAPGSSMSWTLEMLTESVNALPLRDYRLDAELVAANGGYTSQSVTIWSPRGEPIALSRQSMVVFG
ncbi:MAG TPA: thioesterase family protein [Polyangiaceae bacterium]|nr:thioesterase family protein [Polyangiaceae bacterium]